jgi:hypothetical protein
MMIDGDSADISQPSKAQRYAKQLSSVRWLFAFLLGSLKRVHADCQRGCVCILSTVSVETRPARHPIPLPNRSPTPHTLVSPTHTVFLRLAVGRFVLLGRLVLALLNVGGCTQRGQKCLDDLNPHSVRS